MDVKTIGVVGAGTMGGGIAQVAATAGFAVILNDLKPELLERSLKGIDKSVSKLIEKGKIAEDEAAILARIKATTSLADFRGADFAVEAVVEDLAVKKSILQELDRLMAPERIIVSNTSSISITRLAALTSRPGRFMGMHFMNPAPLMVLVELIKGIATTPETFAAVKALAEKMGKVTAEANDFPGFIANRLQSGSYVSAQSALAFHGMIPEHVPVVTSVGPGRPETVRNSLGSFQFRHLAGQLLFGYSQVEVAPKQFAFVASPEKSLLDLIHLTAGADSEKYLRQLRLQNPEVLHMAMMIELAQRSGKPKLIRAARLVGPLLEEERGESI